MDHIHLTFALHKWCILYEPLIWMHVAANLAIALAYVGIPLQILRFMRQNKLHFPNHDILYLTAAFILSCGLSHVMAAWTMVVSPNYVVEAVVLVITALVSLITMVRLVPAIRYFAGFRDMVMYREQNHDLRNENQQILLKFEEQKTQIEEMQQTLIDSNRTAHMERVLLIQQARDNIQRIEALTPLLLELAGKNTETQEGTQEGA